MKEKKHGCAAVYRFLKENAEEQQEKTTAGSISAEGSWAHRRSVG